MRVGMESYVQGESCPGIRQILGTLEDINLDLLIRDRTIISTIVTLYHSYLDMNRRQQVLSFPRVPTYQERMLDVIKRSHNSIQALDPRTRSIKTFPWYALTL
jgi:hypothetical protein